MFCADIDWYSPVSSPFAVEENLDMKFLAIKFIFTLFVSPRNEVHMILAFPFYIVSVAVRVPLFLPALIIFQPIRVEESVIYVYKIAERCYYWSKRPTIQA